MIFPSWLGFVFCFAFCSCHAFYLIASSALHRHFVAVIFQNLHLHVIAVSPFASITIPRTALPSLTVPDQLGFRFTLVKPPTPSCARPKTSPNPNRSVITVGFRSSPNIPKISSVLCWTPLSYVFSTVEFWSYDPTPLFSHIYILSTPNPFWT